MELKPYLAPFLAKEAAVRATEAQEAACEVLSRREAEKYAVLLVSGHPDWYVDVGDEQLCEKAAWYGHLEALQWERNNGYPCDENTCSSAAINRHLDVLQ
ncbi:unnamed protein product [Ectocarpus sp. CCAP 1310/34]|nr:unnamed protein product [Ectocarpus sp. CCAP 1310/34]